MDFGKRNFGLPKSLIRAGDRPDSGPHFPIDPSIRCPSCLILTMKSDSYTDRHQMCRFETELLATEDNLAALADLGGARIDRGHERKPPKVIVLDVGQLGRSDLRRPGRDGLRAGVLDCACYRALFDFNQFGRLDGTCVSTICTTPTTGATCLGRSLARQRDRLLATPQNAA